jgi:hypothetical protein
MEALRDPHSAFVSPNASQLSCTKSHCMYESHAISAMHAREKKAFAKEQHASRSAAGQTHEVSRALLQYTVGGVHPTILIVIGFASHTFSESIIKLVTQSLQLD